MASLTIRSAYFIHLLTTQLVFNLYPLSPSNRAQRASARGLTNPTVPVALDEPPVDYDDSMALQDMPLDSAPIIVNSEVAPLSQVHLTMSDHVSGAPEEVGNGDVVVIPPPTASSSVSANGRKTRKSRDKGKGKEKMQDEIIRIKEEPVAVVISDFPSAPTVLVRLELPLDS